MKKLFILFLLLLICSTASARDCEITGKFEDVIKNLNGIAEMMTLLDDVPYGNIDPDKCDFEIRSSNQGLYICEVNATTAMYIQTDKYLNAESFQIHGLTNTNVPSKATYNWSYIATSAACMDLNLQDTTDLFIEAFQSGYYKTKDITIVSGMHPDADNLWVYIISNN